MWKKNTAVRKRKGQRMNRCSFPFHEARVTNWPLSTRASWSTRWLNGVDQLSQALYHVLQTTEPCDAKEYYSPWFLLLRHSAITRWGTIPSFFFLILESNNIGQTDERQTKKSILFISPRPSPQMNMIGGRAVVVSPHLLFCPNFILF